MEYDRTIHFAEIVISFQTRFECNIFYDAQKRMSILLFQKVRIIVLFGLNGRLKHCISVLFIGYQY